METIIFDGTKAAFRREKELRERVRLLKTSPRLCSVVFDEDEGSQLYTRLKFEAAVRVGIDFDRSDHSMAEPVENLKRAVEEACGRTDVHGVMIQKPSKRVWKETTGLYADEAFDWWWHQLTGRLDPKKDVDGLSPDNLTRVLAGKWRRLPATVKAVLSILEMALKEVAGCEVMLANREAAKKQWLKGMKAVVIGTSDIVGKPLAAVLQHAGAEVLLADSRTENLRERAAQAHLLVSATGKRNLVTGSMVKDKAIVIDVGAPGSDVIYKEVVGKASFLTPVPYGVGPMTVVSLLENLVDLAR